MLISTIIVTTKNSVTVIQHFIKQVLNFISKLLKVEVILLNFFLLIFSILFVYLRLWTFSFLQPNPLIPHQVILLTFIFMKYLVVFVWVLVNQSMNSFVMRVILIVEVIEWFDQPNYQIIIHKYLFFIALLHDSNHCNHSFTLNSFGALWLWMLSSWFSLQPLCIVVPSITS